MAPAGRPAAQGTLDLPVHLNEHYDWDTFDPQDYFLHNYESMRADDAKMLALVRDWFARAVPAGARLEHGIDVGSGSNLYPTLALLPHCSAITLYEYSRENVEWLESRSKGFPTAGCRFWQLLCPAESAEDFEDARARVREGCTVQGGSIFDLPGAVGDRHHVLRGRIAHRGPRRVRHRAATLLGALKPGAPFAAAFMEGSEGYDVGEVHFPAVLIDEERLRRSIDALGTVSELDIRRVAIDPAPLRPGYTGYLVAIGKVQG